MIYIRLAIATSLLSLGFAAPVTAAEWQARQVGAILAPDYRDCVFFQLVGVSEADPAVPGTPWIAIPRTQLGFKEMYSMLLWAKSSGTPLTIYTTGAAATGVCAAGGPSAAIARMETT